MLQTASLIAGVLLCLTEAPFAQASNSGIVLGTPISVTDPSFYVPIGQTREEQTYGCYDITNNSPTGDDVYVPLQFEPEWDGPNGIMTLPPAGVSFAPCVGGTSSSFSASTTATPDSCWTPLGCPYGSAGCVDGSVWSPGAQICPAGNAVNCSLLPSGHVSCSTPASGSVDCTYIPGESSPLMVMTGACVIGGTGIASTSNGTAPSNGNGGFTVGQNGIATGPGSGSYNAANGISSVGQSSDTPSSSSDSSNSGSSDSGGSSGGNP